MEGIKKRWVYNYIVLLACILLVIEGAFIIFIQRYYYDNIENDLTNQVGISSGFYNKFLKDRPDDLNSLAKQLIQDTTFKDPVEMQILDTSGNIIMSSSGFLFNETIGTEDYKEAYKGERTATWTGKDEITGEKVMSVSSALKQSSDNTIGVLRYVTSLEEVDNVIRLLIVASLIVIFIILSAMLLLSLIFSKSIIKPLNELNAVANKMADGQFSERVERRYNDEIGELADTLNYMAGEIVAANRLKNDFISSISHELRTPLTSIKGWGETILTGGLDDKEETELGLNIIIKETTRLSEMVEELLDFSRIESGRITLHLEPIDILSVLNEIVHMFKHRGKKDGVIVKYNYPVSMPEIMGDQNRLRQVFINIIDNAIKFTDSGKRVFVIMNSDPTNVYIKIIDEGAGISEEDLPKVKEKFFKGTSKKSGSGIGLAVSDEIIKLHGGEFDIESEEGSGSTMTITLPINIDPKS